jgi:hypothetical protein
MTRLLLASALLFALEASAAAQANSNSFAVSTFDPSNAVAPISAVEGPGVKIGEGTVIHPVFGIETGVVSNVFYEAVDPNAAGVLRLLAQVGTGSLPMARLASMGADDDSTDKGSVQYRADLRASYDFILTSDDTASETGGLGLGASVHALFNPMGRLSFGIDEDFQRLIRATNYETDSNTNRDVNALQLTLLYHPRDRTLGGYLYYNNTIDIFERDVQKFADRWANRIGIHPTWQWLPNTQIYADVSQGIASPLGGSSTKVTSYPFAATAGIATLFTLKTTLNLYGGYTNGFYSSGPSFSAPLVGATVGYRYSPLGRVALSYSLQYQDSVNANYYRDHVVQLVFEQLVAPFVLVAQPEIHLREYNGVTIVDGPMTRDDFIFAVVAGVHYNFRNWVAATLNYRFSMVETDYRYMPIGGGAVLDPSYARHELLAGMRIAL